MHFLKKGQKIRAWVDLPPSFGQCPKENVFFFNWGLPLGQSLIARDGFKRALCGELMMTRMMYMINLIFITMTITLTTFPVAGHTHCKKTVRKWLTQYCNIYQQIIMKCSDQQLVFPGQGYIGGDTLGYFMFWVSCWGLDP